MTGPSTGTERATRHRRPPPPATTGRSQATNASSQPLLRRRDRHADVDANEQQREQEEQRRQRRGLMELEGLERELEDLDRHDQRAIGRTASRDGVDDR